MGHDNPNPREKRKIEHSGLKNNWFYFYFFRGQIKVGGEGRV